MSARPEAPPPELREERLEAAALGGPVCVEDHQPEHLRKRAHAVEGCDGEASAHNLRTGAPTRARSRDNVHGGLANLG